MCRSLRRRANACQQFGADEGFRDQVECPQVKRSGPFLGRREIAVQNHGHQPRRVFLLHPAPSARPLWVGRRSCAGSDRAGSTQPRQRPRSDRPPGRPRSRRPARCCTVARTRSRGLDDQHSAREVGRIQIGTKPHVVISPKSWKTKGERDLTTRWVMAVLVSCEIDVWVVLVTDVLRGQHGERSAGRSGEYELH